MFSPGSHWNSRVSPFASTTIFTTSEGPVLPDAKAARFELDDTFPEPGRAVREAHRVVVATDGPQLGGAAVQGGGEDHDRRDGLGLSSRGVVVDRVHGDVA